VQKVIVGTAIGVSIGKYPRWYVLVLSRGRDEEGRTVYTLVAQRDDGRKYMALLQKERLEVEDISKLMDRVVERIREDDGFDFFELLCGSGMLSLVYVRGLWA
jgi:hypothetical protein